MLLIPEVEGIVIYKDGVYGIINSTGKQLIRTELEQVYSETSGGKNTYYMVFNGQTINILELLEKSNSGEKNEVNPGNNNTNTNPTNTSTTNSTKNEQTNTNTTNSNQTNTNAVNTTNTAPANNNSLLPSTKNALN